MRSPSSNAFLPSVHRLARRVPLVVLLTGLAVAACSSDTEETPQAEDATLPEFDFGPPVGNDTQEEPDLWEDDDIPPEPQDGGDTVVPDVCSPNCGGRVCGDDGCGGSCGDCDAGFDCSLGGKCVANGDSCAGSLLVGDLPWDYQGTGDGLTDLVTCTVDETTHGSGTGERVFEFRPPTDQPYRVTLQSTAGASVSVLKTCTAPGSCVANGVPGEEVVFSGPVEVPIYLAVEAQPEQSFSLAVRSCTGACVPGFCGIGKCGIQCNCTDGLLCHEESCVSPPDGDTCATSPTLSTFPATVSGSLTLASNAAACAATPDISYRLRSASDVGVTVGLTAGPGVTLHVSADCSNAAACQQSIGPGESVGLSLLSDVSRFLVVEGPADASFSINVDACNPTDCSDSCPCPGGQVCTEGTCALPTGGDGCDDALALSPGVVGFSTANVSDSQSCGTAPPLREAVFGFSAPHAGEWGFDVTANRPLQLYLLDTCGDSATCANSAQDPPRLTRTFETNDSVTVVVEEVIPGPGGSFELSVTDCEAECAAASCDAVVCGKQCGCDNGEVCAAGTCVLAEPLDSCETAQLIGTVPSTVVGDLTALNDAVSCAGGTGQGSADAIYQLVAPVTGLYSLNVTGIGTPLLLPLAGCDAGPQPCKGNAGTSLVLFLHAGESRHIAVDSLGAGSSYTLSVSTITSYPGALGSACTTAADCPLADACIAGVCSWRCEDDDTCANAIDGPRGSSFGCSTGPCEGDSCVAWCLPGVTDSTPGSCTRTADCAGLVCGGYLPDAAGTPSGFCLAAGSLLGAQQVCTSDTQCASNQCSNGRCSSLCVADADCVLPSGGIAGRCRLHLEAAGSDLTPLGLCRTIPGGYGADCSSQANCAGGSTCQSHLNPAGQLSSYCQQALGTATQGESCNADSDCATGQCVFQDSNDAYCSSACTEVSGCSGGSSCRTLTLWDAGTPEPNDDYTLKRCLRGDLSAPCFAWGVDVCNSGFACSATAGELLGTCLPQ